MYLEQTIMTASLTIGLDCDNEELEFYISILQGLVEKNNIKEAEWKNRRREQKKKKTVEEIIEEIEEDLTTERTNIIDANVEIENLELKRSEVEKLESKIVDDKALKEIVKKVKVVRKKKTDAQDLVRVREEPLLID